MSGARFTGLALALAVAGCGAAPHVAAPPWATLSGVSAMSSEYRDWLDRGRTCSRVVDYVKRRSTQFRVVDVHDVTTTRVRPGDRLLFINRDRTAILVVVGKGSLQRAGARIVGAHIDTPSPQIALRVMDETKQHTLKAFRYGGMRTHHWKNMPLALVGRVARAGGAVVDIELGLKDDFAFYMSSEAKGMTVTASSTPVKDWPEHTARTLVSELHRRYGLTPTDLEAAELFLVPKHRARIVGFGGALIGAHGQDDRANSYAAWRAVVDLAGAPTTTAMAWLVDREEEGSAHSIGAQSRFLELVYAWLIRAQGSRATEASLGRAFARTVVLSADTPAAMNPNWLQVHEKKNAPRLGNGPAMFPHTGRGGKKGGSQAHAELVRSVIDAFARAKVPLQFGELGKVDEGGGGTIAKYLGERGANVVDVGVAVVSMHSPMEVSATADVWSAYRGFREWLSQ